MVSSGLFLCMVLILVRIVYVWVCYVWLLRCVVLLVIYWFLLDGSVVWLLSDVVVFICIYGWLCVICDMKLMFSLLVLCVSSL